MTLLKTQKPCSGTARYLVLGLFSLCGCVGGPTRSSDLVTTAMAPARAGVLAAHAERLATGRSDTASTYWLVASSHDAVVSRLALLDTAIASLDIQYFIWEDDVTGELFLERLLAAADRGVHVRLLIDDVSVVFQDRAYAALAMHPNIELRTFNPWRARSRVVRAGEFLLRPKMLNHRLHNKTIIADGQLALLGGRNIGDRYFGVYDVFVQNDLDVLFAGPMIEHAAANFDLFWNAPLSLPIDSVLGSDRRGQSLEDVRVRLASGAPHRDVTLAAFSIDRTDWTGWLDSLVDRGAQGEGEFIEDLPPTLDAPPNQIRPGVLRLLASAERELVLSTAYFIPDEELRALLKDLTARGVHVSVLTNSIQSNNHMLAHVAYKRSRRELLRAGIELYELKPDAALLEEYGVDPVEPGFMGLHAKAAVVDGRWAFIGTPNLDPRSLNLNVESGIIVDSPALAAELRALILDASAGENAWRLVLDGHRDLEWTSQGETLERQPAAGIGQRIIEFLYMLLPIKDQA